MNKIAVVIMMIGYLGLSQEKNMKPNRAGLSDFTPEQTSTLRVKKMTLALDLTDAQQAKIKTILLEDIAFRKSKLEERKSKEQNKLSTNERFTRKNEKLDHQIALKKEIKSILNQEQYEKWEKNNHNKRKQRHGKFAKKLKSPRKR